MQKSILFLSLLWCWLVGALVAQTPAPAPTPAPAAANPPAAQPATTNPPQAPAADTGFVREFGSDGTKGSFRARFSKLGGGIVFLQLMDHYASLEAARRSPHDPKSDYLLLISGAEHALGIVGGSGETHFAPDLARAEWSYKELPDGVEFSIDSGSGLQFVKRLKHDPSQRGFVLELELRNTGTGPGTTEPGTKVSFQLLGPELINKVESSLVGTSSVGIVGTGDGEQHHVGPKAGTVQKLEFDPAKWTFAGNTNRFFGAFLYPLDPASGHVLTGLAVDTLPLQEHEGTAPNTTTRVRYAMTLEAPARNAVTTARFGLYLGPKSYGEFGALTDPQRFAPMLDVDLNAPCCFIEMPGGRPMAKLLLRLLGWFHGVVGNWGLAIMMLTILVRGLLAPLNFRMQKSMRAYSAKMAVLKPKLDALKQRYEDDPKAYQQAMVAFQREHKMIPPIGGCLPIFLTMPVYIGLFTALRTAYDLRQQPFVGWITDLSRSDHLFDLPFWPHTFNLLPLVWIVLYLVMAFRQPLTTDPQQRQMQQMTRYMPLVFGVMLYGYAAALMVYMVTSMCWTLIESTITKRILGPIDPNVAAMTPTPM